MPTLNKISVDNVVYDIGGAFLVTVDSALTTASHSASEISASLSAGTPVFLKIEDQYSVGLLPVTMVDSTDDLIAMACYSLAVENNADGVTIIATITIDDNKAVTVTMVQCVTHDQLTQDIATGDILSKTNTYNYTPTGNYNPATKKYVDDHDYNITSGTADPSGGSDGDIYLKYEV